MSLFRVSSLGRALCAVTVVVLASACGDTGTTNPPPPVPTTLTLSSGAFTLDGLGATQQLTATVKDQNGAAMSGQTISWTSDATGTATVGTDGTVTAVAKGTANITATSGSLTASVAVTVAQTPTAVVKQSGDSQTAVAGAAVTAPLVVLVSDPKNQPIAGIAVTFAVTAGGGSLGTPSAITGADGKASSTWTLGTTAGLQTATATVTGVSAPVGFTATANAGPAAIIATVSGNNQTGLVSAALANPVVVKVTDANNNPVAGTTVAFAVTGGGGSVSPPSQATGANGQAQTTWTLGSGAGANTMTASANGAGGTPLTGSAQSFTATGTTFTVSVNAGNNQTGLVGYALNAAPSALVKDNTNAPAPGVTVTFAVTGGGGSVTGASAVTNASGIAAVGSWVMGATAGANTMTASVSGAASPATFSATGANKAFNIDVRFIGTPPAAFTMAINNAVAKWQTIIYGDIQDVAINNLPANSCISGQPAVNETIDDVVIFAKTDSIDGPNNILGVGGPCLLRTSGPNAKLAVIGIMKFDTADVATMQANGTLSDVVLHEMGHVLGIGTVWPDTIQASPLILGFGLLKGAAAKGGMDPYFNGANGLAAFAQLGGGNYTGGSRVPVENVGGAGSLDSHWRESVFGNELMTSTIAGPGNPLSVLTAGSLIDLGYTVNLAGADAYTQVFHAPTLAGVASPGISLGDDVWHGPLFVVDQTGRVTRIR